MGIKRETISERFDPFTDRTARDIRNTLSDAFVAAVADRNPAKYLFAAGKWQSQNLPAAHAAYIDDRLRRYEGVFHTIRAEQINDPLQQALVVWNQGLFFEFHDHLEPIWQAAAGDQREALKGLIKAAGVYIHLKQHHRQAARSLAMKAFRLLRQHHHCLVFIANTETLLDKLENGDPVPPRLEIAPFDE